MEESVNPLGDSTESPIIALDEPQPSDLVLRVLSAAKSFGATRALADADLFLRRGEVHALVGENGSGKSTLVKILSGVHKPDSGTITIGENDVPSFGSTRASQEAGIGTVFQEVLSIESRSVLENVWLGTERWRSGPSKNSKRAQAEKLLAELLETPPQVDQLVEELSLSDRQACGIVRAVLRNPRVLILDEATSALDIETRSRLFRMVRRLGESGTATVIITHRMDEIEEIADRITVMRSGQTVAELERGSWTDEMLVKLMTGAATSESFTREEDRSLGVPVLEARSLQLKTNAAAMDLTIRAGEIVGVAGLEGHGQEEFLRAFVGAPVSSGIVVCLKDEGARDRTEYIVRSPRQAATHGIVYVPRDRRAESIFGWMSILENFGVATMAQDSVAGLLSGKRTADRLSTYIDKLKIKLGDSSHAITTLSGGNQQKVIIGRWLAANPSILVLNDPTRGIDINAKRDIYALLAELAATGIAVVMLSTDVNEQIELMDRVLVFREHELSAEIQKAGLTREKLVGSFFTNQIIEGQVHHAG